MLLGACGDGRAVTGPNCADVGIPAITLVALESRTRQPIMGKALVIARDGAYADTADAIGSPPTYALAYNRPGTYNVTLQLAGYAPWQLERVVAARGQCNVTSVPLAAWLIPSTFTAPASEWP
jgi:hypothetical protein